MFVLSFGDFGSDSDAFLLTAYSGANGTGSVVGTTTVDQGTSSITGTVGTATFAGSSFQSVTFIRGSTSFPNSLYYDNLVATVGGVMPEPSTWAMMLLGFGALGWSLRRRRTSAKALQLA